MKKILGLAFVFLVGCGGGGSDAPTATTAPVATVPSAVTSVPPPNYQQEKKIEIFNRINEIRSQVGLGLLMQSTKLDIAAQGHSNYQVLNNVQSHDQIIGRPGYTGVDLGIRAASAGYDALTMAEVISYAGELGGRGQVENLMAAAYHRSAFLNYKYRDIGIGEAFYQNSQTVNAMVINVAYSLPLKEQGSSVPYVLWPQNNSTIPRLTNPPEIPKPPGLGYPVSINFDPNKAITVDKFELKEGGAQIETHFIEPETGFVMLSPRLSLKPLTKYTVVFEGSLDSKPLIVNWSFNTP